MDQHIFQKSHRSSHGDSFSQSIDGKIDFDPRSNSIIYEKIDAIRGRLLCLSDRARTETARILCAEHLAISLVEKNIFSVSPKHYTLHNSTFFFLVYFPGLRKNPKSDGSMEYIFFFLDCHYLFPGQPKKGPKVYRTIHKKVFANNYQYPENKNKNF